MRSLLSFPVITGIFVIVMIPGGLIPALVGVEVNSKTFTFGGYVD